MKVIRYADPPYPGQAKKHYAHDPQCAEVDHRGLIADLETSGDSWALSTSSTALREVLLVAPADIRIGAWVKPFASFKPGVNPAYTWEPVLYRTQNRPDRQVETVRDHVIADAVSCPITLRRGLTGAKPEAFCFWLFELLGAEPGDEFVDLFPGTGGVTEAWNLWCQRRCGKHPAGSLFTDVA